MIEAVLFVAMLAAIFLILRQAKQIELNRPNETRFQSLFAFNKSNQKVEREKTKGKP